MMSPRGRLCAVFVAVLVGAAVDARPGLGDNEVASPVKPTENVSNKPETVETKTSTDPKPAPAEVVKAVNERYPHAVLFGGTCGGTIISPKWILTAGHCTLFTGGRYVLAGTNNSDDDSGTYRQVERLVIHPLFTVGPYWLNADQFNIKQVAARWDFMLVELKEELPLDGKLMAAAPLAEEVVTAGTDVGYAGYGAEHHGGTMRSEMHSMELSVQDDESCKTLEQYNPQDMLCTKGRPPRYDSACNGDSGSGLVDSSGRLIGVASWVENDAHECRNGALVVFSRVSSVRDWIRQVTKV